MTTAAKGIPPGVEAWLRYFDDLGLAPFFLTRRESTVARAIDAVAVPSPNATFAAATATGQAPTVRPPTSPVPRPQLSNQPPPRPVVAAPTFVKPSPGLFDERVENDTLERVRADIGDCTRCRLCERRNKIVFGDGNFKARLVFVGEGPGQEEDLQGLPFVGRAGKLLTQMIEAMGLKREVVYICNVVKCRPPGNRTPEKDEMAACSPFLLRQLEVIHPQVIVCLGAVAAQVLIGTNKAMSHLRGQWFDYQGAKLLATYHPAYLLRNPNAKGDVWKDLQRVMVELGLPVPPSRKSS